MTITLTLDPAGPTKREIIELAFGDCAMAGYEFGRTAEEVADAQDRLNALMYEWPFSTLGFVHSDYGTGLPDESSGIPFDTLNVVAARLALRIAPMMGKSLPLEAKANLARGMALLHARAATIPASDFASNTLAGAGTRGMGTFLRPLPVDSTADDDPGNLAGLLP